MTASSPARPHGRKLDDAADAAEELRESAEELYEQGEEALHTLRGKVEAQVQHHPLSALVVAGGVGLLIGLLIGRRQ